MESQFETQFLALRKKYIEAQFGKLNPVQRDAVKRRCLSTVLRI